MELSGSESNSGDDWSDSEENSDSGDDEQGITEQNLKLPGHKGNKAHIQVLDEPVA